MGVLDNGMGADVRQSREKGAEDVPGLMIAHLPFHAHSPGGFDGYFDLDDRPNSRRPRRDDDHFGCTPRKIFGLYVAECPLSSNSKDATLCNVGKNVEGLDD